MAGWHFSYVVCVGGLALGTHEAPASIHHKNRVRLPLVTVGVMLISGIILDVIVATLDISFRQGKCRPFLGATGHWSPVGRRLHPLTATAAETRYICIFDYFLLDQNCIQQHPILNFA